MKPSLPITWLCLCASFLLVGCPDTKLPTPPSTVPKPKAAMTEQAIPAVALTGALERSRT